MRQLNPADELRPTASTTAHPPAVSELDLLKHRLTQEMQALLGETPGIVAIVESHDLRAELNRLREVCRQQEAARPPYEPDVVLVAEEVGRWTGDPESVPCPRPGCGAGVGQRCKRSTLGAHSWHRARVDAAGGAA